MKKFIVVALSSYLSIIISLVYGLYLPKVLDVADFAQLKIFTFYIGFLSIFFLGIIEYTLTEYSKYSFSETKEKTYNSLLFVAVLINFVFVIILIFINAITFGDSIYTYILLFAIPLNTMTSFASLSRANKKFYLSSIISLIVPIVQLVILVLMDISGASNYEILIISRFTAAIASIIMFIIIYRSLFFKKISLKAGFTEYKKAVVIGLPLVVSYFVGMLAFGLDRIFIEYTQSTTSYAYYAFAYSLISIFFASLRAISTFSVPYLKNFSFESKQKFYIFITKFFTIFGLGFSFSVIIMPYFLDFAYPHYSESAIIFSILTGVTLFQVQYTLKQRLYFVVDNKGNSNIIANLVLLVLAIIANCIVYILDLPYYYYAVATLITYIIWQFIIEIYFSKSYNIFSIKYFASNLLISMNILLIYVLLENTIAFTSINIIILLFYLKDILKLVKFIKTRDINEVLSY